MPIPLTPIADYKLGSLRYDLSKLRTKGLVEKAPREAVKPSLVESGSNIRSLSALSTDF